MSSHLPHIGSEHAKMSKSISNENILFTFCTFDNFQMITQTRNSTASEMNFLTLIDVRSCIKNRYSNKNEYLHIDLKSCKQDA